MISAPSRTTEKMVIFLSPKKHMAIDTGYERSNEQAEGPSKSVVTKENVSQ